MKISQSNLSYGHCKSQLLLYGKLETRVVSKSRKSADFTLVSGNPSPKKPENLRAQCSQTRNQ